MQARADAHQVRLQLVEDPDLRNHRDLPGEDHDDDDPSAPAAVVIQVAESDSCESEEMVVCHQPPDRGRDPALDEDELSVPDSGYGESEPERRSLEIWVARIVLLKTQIVRP